MSAKESTSVVWSFFDKIDNSVKCKLCKKVLKFSGSTTGMISHVSKQHEMELRNLQRKKKSNSLEKSPSEKKDIKEETEDCLVMAVVTGNIPFRFVKNPWFKKYCNLLNPDFQVFSPDKLRKKLTENSDRYTLLTKAKLSKIDKCFVTLDGWENKYEQVSLYALFIYFVDEEFKPQKIFLGIKALEGKATAVNIGNSVDDLLKIYGVHFGQIVGAISDAAPNLTAFLDRTDIYHIHCAAHSLSLLLKAASEVPSVSDVLKKINALAAHLSRSKTERSAFRLRSSLLKIKHRIPLPFCVTRWGGSAMLAECYLEHYQSISALTRFQEFLLTPSEKSTIEEYVHFTKPYVQAIECAEKDETLCSEIIAQFSSLHKFISKEDSRKSLIQLMKTETSNRFKAFLDNDVTLLATFCDPRFCYMKDFLMGKSWEFCEQLAVDYCESYRMVGDESEELTEPPEKQMKDGSNSVFREFIKSRYESEELKTPKTEIVHYKANILSGRPHFDSSPLDFWKINSLKYPHLSRMARHVLSSPQSSAQVERLFSKCGEIVASSRRNRLSAQTLNAILLNTSLAYFKENVKEDELSEDDSEEDIFEEVNENEQPDEDRLDMDFSHSEVFGDSPSSSTQIHDQNESEFN